jgi:hypothetical protein
MITFANLVIVKDFGHNHAEYVRLRKIGYSKAWIATNRIDLWA